MSARLRTLALIAFFAALAALEIAHGLSRLGAMRERRLAELRGYIERRHDSLARELAAKIEAERDHAAFLARSPSVRELLASPETADRRDIEAEIVAYVSAFRGIDAVTVLDASGAERLRCERIGRGVGALPEELLDARGDPALAALAQAAPRNGVAISRFLIDDARVEVVPGRRQVLHYAARVAGEEADAGALILTLYAAPLIGAVRELSPVAGVESRLVDESGPSPLPDERGGERELALRRVLAGRLDLAADRSNLRAEATDVLVARVLAEPPLWLATSIPDVALAAEVAPLRGEHTWIVASMVATTLALAGAAFVFQRLSARAFRLREAELDLAREKREREMEEKLRTSERLTSLGLLTAGVAHEINNPLEGIGNYLALLERPGLSDDKRARYVESVRLGFDRIRDIVRDLLSFGRPELERGLVDLAGVVDRARKLAHCSKACARTRIDVRGLEPPLYVPGDAGRLEQVVLNLLLNAGAATQGQGVIGVSARRSDDGAGEPWVELAVEDDGPGIPEGELSRVFDPFFTTTGGTGLGLAVSFGIVRAHGGEISASNRSSGGARFLVRLPAQREVAPARDRGARATWHAPGS
jgi:signal transduction histidine kinase